MCVFCFLLPDCYLKNDVFPPFLDNCFASTVFPEMRADTTFHGCKSRTSSCQLIFCATVSFFLSHNLNMQLSFLGYGKFTANT